MIKIIAIFLSISMLTNCSIIKSINTNIKNKTFLKYLEENEYQKVINFIRKNPSINFDTKNDYNNVYFFLGKYSLRKLKNNQDALDLFYKEIMQKHEDKIVDSFLYYSYLSALEIVFDIDKNYTKSISIISEAFEFYPNDKLLMRYYVLSCLNVKKSYLIKKQIKTNKSDYNLYTAMLGIKNKKYELGLSYLIKSNEVLKEDLSILKTFFFDDKATIFKKFSNLQGKDFEYLYLAKYYFVHKRAKALVFYKKFIKKYDKEKSLDFLMKEYYLSIKIDLSTKNILEMESLFLPRLKTNQTKAILYEYISRLYRYLGRVKNGDKAIVKSLNFNKYDTNIWLFVRYILYKDRDDTKKSLKDFLKYLVFIKDRDYFSDIFDRICSYFLENTDYESLMTFYISLKDFLDDENRAKFCIAIYSLLNQNKIKVKNKQKYKQDLLDFLQNQKTSTYYHILGLYLAKKPISIYTVSKTPYQAIKKSNLEPIIIGYVQYDMIDIAYRLTLDFKSEISTKTLIYVAKSLHKKKMYYQGLRIIGAARFRKDFAFTKENLMIIYPQAFKYEMHKANDEFEISSYVFYGLVRAESFFNPNIGSRVGAKGLSQLMDVTARGVAQGLEMKNFDVFDPYSNLRVGNKYLHFLLSRFDNNIAYALSGYNAGYGNLKKWLKFVNHKDFLIFTASIPFWDTRHYIKDILEASVFYGALYYDKKPYEVVDEFFVNYNEKSDN